MLATLPSLSKSANTPRGHRANKQFPCARQLGRNENQAVNTKQVALRWPVAPPHNSEDVDFKPAHVVHCSHMGVIAHGGFPGGSVVNEPACQCWRCRSRRFDPWVGKIPWRKKGQPTPVLLPGKSHGWRSLVGSSPWGREEPNSTCNAQKARKMLPSRTGLSDCLGSPAPMCVARPQHMEQPPPPQVNQNPACRLRTCRP